MSIGVFGRSHTSFSRNASSCGWIPKASSYGMCMASAAFENSSISSSLSDRRRTALPYATGSRRSRSRSWRTAARRFARAMTLVKRLSLTTVVYSSGPVTPWMWNDECPSNLRQNPRSAQSLAVSTRMSMASRARKSTSPVAATYCDKACATSASMWYCAVPAA